jgi:hypothetical protein
LRNQGLWKSGIRGFLDQGGRCLDRYYFIDPGVLNTDLPDLWLRVLDITKHCGRVLGCSYPVYCPTRTHSVVLEKYLGTPGKMLLRLRVVDAHTGQAISTPKAIGRYLGYYVSVLPLMLGIIWVGIDKKKQGFHDKLAGTVVIRDRQKEPVTFDS